MTGKFVISVLRSRAGDDAGLGLTIITARNSPPDWALSLLPGRALPSPEWCQEDQYETAPGKEGDC